MPELTASPALRWARAFVVAGIALGLGVAAHVLAGGLLPALPVLALLLGGLGVVSASALGRPASYPLLAALVGGGQMMVHLGLTATAGHGMAHQDAAGTRPSLAGPAPATTRGVHDDLSVVAPVPGAPVTAPHWLQHLQEDLTGPNALMALAHLAVAACLAAWLFVGEQALWAVLALVAARVVARLLDAAEIAISTRPLHFAPTHLAAKRRSSVLVSRYLASGPTGRRGPPMPRFSPLLPSAA